MSRRAAELTPDDVPESSTPAGVPLRVRENRLGSQEARLLSVRLTDRWGKLTKEIASGDPLVLLFDVEVPPTVEDANLGVHLLRTDDGVLCLDTSTKLSSIGGTGRRRSVRLEFGRLDLGAGAYEFEVGLYSAGWEHPYDYHWHAYPLSVTGDSVGAAVLSPPLVWAADPRQSSAAEV